MNIAIVTGSAGLVGSESVHFLSTKFDKIIGIDSDMRGYFFGEDASTKWNRMQIEKKYPNYEHYSIDIRDYGRMEKEIFKKYSSDIKLIIHTAAQPSHDWAAKEPMTDFTVNANGTFNLLELTRFYCEKAVMIYTSSNKVYGDTPNKLPLIELETRWEIDPLHPYFDGIDENMNIDQCTHSLFGASKLSADVVCQEYGRYFGMNTGIFRGGCLTGPKHTGTMLHGFLSYLVDCAVSDKKYTIFGYKGKQVRDNIHSEDLINMFWEFYKAPRPGEVYNAGGGRFSNCSVLEAIDLTEKIEGKKMNIEYSETNRIGDHIWYISDLTKFKNHYPEWEQKYKIGDIIKEIYIARFKEKHKI